jgi:hypothetical protein
MDGISQRRRRRIDRGHVIHPNLIGLVALSNFRSVEIEFGLSLQMGDVG